MSKNGVIASICGGVLALGCAAGGFAIYRNYHPATPPAADTPAIEEPVKDDSSELQEKLKSANDKVEALTAEKATLTASLTAKGEQITALTAAKTAAEEQVKTLTAQKSQVETSKASVERQLAVKIAECTALSNQVELKTTEAAELSVQLSASCAEKTVLQAQLATVQIEKSTLQEQLTAACSEKSALQEQLAVLVSENEAITSQLEAANEQIVTLQSEKATLEGGVESLTVQLAEVTAELEEMSVFLNQIENTAYFSLAETGVNVFLVANGCADYHYYVSASYELLSMLDSFVFLVENSASYPGWLQCSNPLKTGDTSFTLPVSFNQGEQVSDVTIVFDMELSKISATGEYLLYYYFTNGVCPLGYRVKQYSDMGNPSYLSQYVAYGTINTAFDEKSGLVNPKEK